jgi:uncharacterized coiled-coil DUF342 family protein
MKHLFTLALIFCLLVSLSAQQKNADICKEGDCSANLFSIRLSEPLQPSPPNSYSSERTKHFKEAYQAFQKIKMTYAQKDKWKEKWHESQLGGKSCMRHYQLEAQFSYEYLHNPDFKKFVDSSSSTVGSVVQNGFDSSRKGLNLSRRMSSNCDEEVKDLESKPGPSLAELPKTYQKLGQELRYFDEDGKLMKPLDLAASTGQDISKMSKGKQVKALKEQLSQMPFEQVMNDKIGGLQNTLGGAQSKLTGLTGAVSLLNSKFGSFVPSLSGLSGNVTSAVGHLGAMKDLGSLFPKPDLFSSIGSLFGVGKGLEDKAKGLMDKANSFKDKLKDLTNKSDKLKDKFENKKSAIDKLKDEIDAISKKKAELQAKLEDKPKKILNQLRNEVPDVVKKANNLLDKVVKEVKDKNNFSEELDKLEKEKEEIENQMKSLESEKDEIKKDFEELEQKKDEAEKAVEELKKKKDKIDKLKEQIEDLKSEKELESKISDCETGLKNMLLSITGLNKKQKNVRSKLSGIISLPSKLTSKPTEIELLRASLELPQNDEPIASNLISQLDSLLQQTTGVNPTLEFLKTKGVDLQKKVEGFDLAIDQIKVLYKNGNGNLISLKSELPALISEKTNIKSALANGFEKVDELKGTVNNYIERFNLFDTKSDCTDKKEIKDEIDMLTDEFEQTEPQIDELENEVREQIQKAEELKMKEKAIKEEFGSDIKLDPVTVEEWSESLEVERPYWEAVFHPDDEVVEGQKGRYFEVKLKDANKNVKLLFGPGQYYMSKSDFRKKYGSTIGSFVTEALHALKKGNQEKVKLFIQGSADIVGHKTFSGKLDQTFLYENINVLPQKDDPEKFSNVPVAKEIPKQNFRNNHLPDLRAQYLKEMIKVYSKKFDPIVLEGVVKDFKDKAERNAIIYLYIPEELLKEK